MDAVQAVVGIDVSKTKLDIALLFNEKVRSKVVENSPAGFKDLLEWIGKSKASMAELHFCMEATGVYYEALAFAMHEAGHRVSVVNPACIKGFGHSENIRNKNDAIDAGLIARYCARMTPALWSHLR
ncbi:MAG: transposase family protein [Massilia sp.]|nr:transposase family protein [Massilia sp.]